MVDITTLIGLHQTYRLFKTVEGNELIAEFDNKGFWFNQDAQAAYDMSCPEIG
jgi:hypothetical protein